MRIDDPYSVDIDADLLDGDFIVTGQGRNVLDMMIVSNDDHYYYVADHYRLAEGKTIELYNFSHTFDKSLTEHSSYHDYNHVDREAFTTEEELKQYAAEWYMKHFSIHSI